MNVAVNAPTNAATLPAKISSVGFNEVIILKLARELAMDIKDPAQIQQAHAISPLEWEQITATPLFLDYYRQAVGEWQSAKNTPERVRLKSLMIVEEALPEFYARMHDPKEPLSAKTEVLKTVSRLGGVGGNVDGTISGEKLSVTINLGADQQVRIEKDITPALFEPVVTSPGNINSAELFEDRL